jgi:hypothetical protein
MFGDQEIKLKHLKFVLNVKVHIGIKINDNKVYQGVYKITKNFSSFIYLKNSATSYV